MARLPILSILVPSHFVLDSARAITLPSLGVGYETKNEPSNCQPPYVSELCALDPRPDRFDNPCE